MRLRRLQASGNLRFLFLDSGAVMLRRALAGLILFAFGQVGRAEVPRVERVEIVVGTPVADGVEYVGPASPLESPFGIDFVAAGTMYVVELEGGRVWERAVDGRLDVIAGDGSKSYRGDGGPARAATFNGMHNVAVTRAGRMLISDTWNNCVREIDLETRTIRTLAGRPDVGFRDGPGAEARFDFVMCVTLTPDERTVLIADINNHRIRALDRETNEVRTIAGNGEKGAPAEGAKALESPLVDPRAVAADSQGRIFILERGGHALRRLDRDGTIHTVAGTGQAGWVDGPGPTAQFNGPKHLAIDDRDRVWIADDENAAIRCWDPETNEVTTILGRGTGDAKVRLSHPHGVCWEAGSLYVADMGNDRVLKVSFAE